MKHPNRLFALCTLALLLTGFGLRPAHADMIFSDFGPGQTYGGSAYWLGGNITLSMGFTSPGAYDVTEIALPLYNNGESAATVSIWTDVSGAPKTELGSWGLTIYNNTSSVQYISGITGVSLSSGGAYFLQVSAPGQYLGWNESTVSGPRYMGGEGGAGNGTLSVFDVQGTPTTAASTGSSGSPAVPEPGITLMLVLALGLLFIFLSRRARQ